MFTLAISFDHFQFTLIHGPNIPGSYVLLSFTALDFIYFHHQTHPQLKIFRDWEFSNEDWEREIDLGFEGSF